MGNALPRLKRDCLRLPGDRSFPPTLHVAPRLSKAWGRSRDCRVSNPSTNDLDTPEARLPHVMPLTPAASSGTSSFMDEPNSERIITPMSKGLVSAIDDF